MARRRRAEAPALEAAPPDWLWGFTMGQFARQARQGGRENWLQDFIDARAEWRRARDAWLVERGLVMSGMAGMTYQEYRRIEREDPHRVLRRPGRTSNG